MLTRIEALAKFTLENLRFSLLFGILVSGDSTAVIIISEALSLLKRLCFDGTFSGSQGRSFAVLTLFLTRLIV